MCLHSLGAPFPQEKNGEHFLLLKLGKSCNKIVQIPLSTLAVSDRHVLSVINNTVLIRHTVPYSHPRVTVYEQKCVNIK